VAAHSRERHRLQAIDSERGLKALKAIETRERQSLETKRLREQRTHERSGHEHMPALTLELKPKGRGASVRKAKNRYQDSLREREERQARVPEEARETSSDLLHEMLAALASTEPGAKTVDLQDAFTRAAEETEGEEERGESEEGSVARKPVSRASKPSERGRARGRGRKDEDFDRER
jgi:hypothetical protein